MLTPITLAEKRILPDPIIRAGIRNLCKQRLEEESLDKPDYQEQRYQKLLHQLRRSDIAIETHAANAQHYELPTQFFQYALGRHMKYSACYWPPGTRSLNEAEALSLALSCERAELEDGQSVLELGCGWGSLTLWMAEHYPNSRIMAVSNSAQQKIYIDDQCQRRDLRNVNVVTADINHLSLDQAFDRVVSIEMFEHMRNYGLLLHRIANWLNQDGKLWVHLFCHRYLMYPFGKEGGDNWMGKYFFSGGIMPAADTLLYFQEHLKCEARWLLPGIHYRKTADAWLERMDNNKDRVLAVFKQCYGDQAHIWFQRWRIFFMACSELFGYNHGNEWLVGHLRFTKTNPAT